MLIPGCILLFVLHTCLCVDVTYYVEEGKSPGTYVGDIATDTHVMAGLPQSARDMVQFNLLGQNLNDNSQWFKVAQKTGKIYTAQMLDAESLCRHNKECFKIIKVAVHRAKVFMKVLKIRVNIQDVNDHQPEFPEMKVSIEFSEESTKGAERSIPNAIDKDVGALNSQLTYQLKKNIDDPFTLSISKSVDGTSDLSITLKDMLDREVKDSYLVQVIAKDGGSPPKQSVLDIPITVTDINDNTPVFSQNAYNVSIRYEHDKAIPVAILSARDLDEGKNGEISYHFSARTSDIAKSHFKIDEYTGEIFVMKTFSQGQNLAFELFVKATDGGNPPLNSIAMVLVNVINQQNNAPNIDVNFFSTQKNTAAISEDVGVGSFIAYVMVTDQDYGPNGEVTCYLNHDKFQLQSLETKEYKITVNNPVDRETEDHHDMTIRCQDKGSPPQHSESKLSIQVIDVNDEKPQFSKEIFKFWIYENQKPNFVVGSVNATDPDLGPGGKLTYSLLTNTKDFLPFQITDKGLISTVMSLDHEFQNSYEFKIFVKDSGIPSLNNTANIVVEVRDENDNAPYFTFPTVNPYSLDMTYYPHHTKNVTILKAADIDSRENAFLKYEIIGGNDKQLFRINHYTGLLSFTRVVTQQDAGSYDLEFVVKDSGTPVLSANIDMILKLTVSNKTLKIMNEKHIKSEKRIHLVLMIVIVLVAVTVSVSITAAMSICIIRCKDRRNASHRDGVNIPCKCVTEHGNYTCPSQQSTYWPDVPVGQSSDPESSGSYTKRSRRGLYPGGELGNGQKCADGDYQSSQRFGRFALRPSSGAPCRTLEPSWNSEPNPLLEPRGYTVRIPFTRPGENEMRTVYSRGSNKGLGSEFHDGSQVRHKATEVGHSAKRPKRCDDSNQDEDTSSKIEIGGTSCGRDNEHKQFMNPDCHSEREDGWSEGDSRHSREGPDLNTLQHCKSPHPMNEQNPRKNIQKKFKQLAHFYPGDAANNSSCRALHKPNIGHIPDCSQWIDLKPSAEDMSGGSHSRPCNMQESRGSNDPHQLPAIRQVPCLEYFGQTTHT